MGGLESRPTNSINTNASEYKKNFGTGLTKLIEKRGYRNKYYFITTIRQETNRSQLQLYEWAKGRRIPTAESMSIILRTLKPEGEELDQLINPWGRILETELESTGQPKSGSESALRSAKAKEKNLKILLENGLKQQQTILKLHLESYPQDWEFFMAKFSNGEGKASQLWST